MSKFCRPSLLLSRVFLKGSSMCNRKRKIIFDCTTENSGGIMIFESNGLFLIYDIFLLTPVGLSPGGSSTVHIYTQTIHRTTQNKQTTYIEQHKYFGRVRTVPLGEFYPGICLTTRGELSYLAPLGSENISAPYFKQCFFRGGGITPQD